ncbi:MAG: phage holin family protein, partial [Thermoguttaceae bacterium]
MRQPDRPLLSEVRRELGRLAADVREFGALRWELARREALADVRAVRRLAVAAAVAAAMALCVLPLLAVAAAWWLDGRLGVPFLAWLLIWAAIVSAAAATVGLLAWRRFRREFTGLAETLEEVREDLVWLQEWTERLE